MREEWERIKAGYRNMISEQGPPVLGANASGAFLRALQASRHQAVILDCGLCLVLRRAEGAAARQRRLNSVRVRD